MEKEPRLDGATLAPVCVAVVRHEVDREVGRRDDPDDLFLVADDRQAADVVFRHPLGNRPDLLAGPDGDDVGRHVLADSRVVGVDAAHRQFDVVGRCDDAERPSVVVVDGGD